MPRVLVNSASKRTRSQYDVAANNGGGGGGGGGNDQLLAVNATQMTLTVDPGLASGATLDDGTQLSYFYDAQNDFVTVSGTVALIGTPINLLTPVGINLTLTMPPSMISPGALVYSVWCTGIAFDDNSVAVPLRCGTTINASQIAVSGSAPGAATSFENMSFFLEIKYTKGT